MLINFISIKTFIPDLFIGLLELYWVCCLYCMWWEKKRKISAWKVTHFRLGESESEIGNGMSELYACRREWREPENDGNMITISIKCWMTTTQFQMSTEVLMFTVYCLLCCKRVYFTIPCCWYMDFFWYVSVKAVYLNVMI